MPSLPAAPLRPPSAIFEPIVTAEQGFPAFERLVFNARRSVWLAFRIFDPETRLRAVTQTGATWMDLLRHKLNEGVEVNVMLSDFDPVGGPDLHEGTWRTAQLLDSLSGDGPLQVLPIRHEARMGRGMRVGLWVPTLKELERQRRELNALDAPDRQAAFGARPGLWRYLRQNRQGWIRWRLALMPRLFPATLHHKLCVTDGHDAIIGGLDIDERRYDDLSHNRQAADTWHDVSVRIDGPAAGDVARHIADVWNANRLRMAALRREQLRIAPRTAPPLPRPARPLEAPDGGGEQSDGQGLQLLRTLSVNRRGYLFRVSPHSEVTEIEEALLARIEIAERMIYLETQFFRSRVIADALVAAAKGKPALNMVLVLPAAPEEVAFDNNAGLGERMGEALQSDCVSAVLDAFGDRAAILSPVRPVATNSPGRDALAGAEIIYVHSKVAIFDAHAAIVGSANLNGRSLRWDTEAAVLVTVPDYVERLRTALFDHWNLKDDVSSALRAPSATAELWYNHAVENAALPPQDRQGFLVPYDPEPATRLGRSIPGIPDELV